ncbi:DUF5339 domain-containing protein, partial [Escherichia coli]|nr:DUF5339 domain-containing protein [Escherichia coli]
GTVCVVGKMRDLILQLSKSSIYSTKPVFVQKRSVFMKTITVLLTTVLFSMSASAALTPACEEYYKEIDNFVAKMKEMGTPEAQVNTLKQQYEQSRKQIAALPDASQDMACKQGLDALRQSMSAAGIK